MKKFNIVYFLTLLCFFLSSNIDAQNKKTNVLFIISDQFRWDALGAAGNLEVKTPNLDRLAKEGVQFTNAYAACPVCVPARTSILTGRSIFNTKVFNNKDANNPKVPDLLSFDQILSSNGYHTEYYGKWHAPYKFASNYDNVVKTTGNVKVKGIPTTVDDFRQYLDHIGVPVRKPKKNELIDKTSQRPYIPLPIDARFGQTNLVQNENSNKKNKKQKLGQGSVFGVLQVPPNGSLAAYMGSQAFEALKDIDTSKPFSITLSIGPPHPPFIVPEKYASMFSPEDMSIPKSIGDDLLNAPYQHSLSPFDRHFQNPESIQQMKSIYYAMIYQVDEWVGKLLDELDRKGIADRTLVVFTSDHGELLGDHGMSGKAKMYEGSAHIPLLMRLPGSIPQGKKIDTPVSHHDLFATILDYTGMAIPKNDGRSLRNLIEGKEDPVDYAVSIWGDLNNGGPFMIRKGDWKLIIYLPTTKSQSHQVNALYNLKTDPLEMNNLIGINPSKADYLKYAQDLKSILRQWMVNKKVPYVKELDKINF